VGMTRSTRTLVALVCGVLLGGGATAVAQKDHPYSPKNGVLNFKALFFGGAFRVTTAIPFRGDFSKFDRIEITKPESLIGPGVPSVFLQKLGEQLKGEFEKGGRFRQVQLVDSFEPPAVAKLPAAPAPALDFRDPDPLQAPMHTWSDLLAFDEQRRLAAEAEAEPEPAVLVVRCQVIDYVKGHRLLQLLMVDLGNSLLTMRFSYYDKSSGEEIGRSVISSDNSSTIIPSALSPRTALAGVSEGLVDQIIRRKLAAER
jgi:hypothetical protein